MPEPTLRNHKRDRERKNIDWESGKERLYFCEFCKKEIKGTALVYLSELYHRSCLYL